MRTESLASIWIVLGLSVLLISAAVGVATAPALARAALDGQIYITRASFAQAAAEQGDTAGLKAMLEADPRLLDCRDAEGWTPLHEAARGGYAGLAKMLLAKGADIDATNDEGKTPLQCAVAAREWKVAKLLLAEGAE